MTTRKTSLDKDLGKIVWVEDATRSLALRLVAPGLALAFLVLAGLIAGLHIGSSGSVVILVAAAVIGGYMALNIGANDVANNVGPAVGAKALSLTGALIIAAVCESAGALIAGADVVSTISKGIVEPDRFDDARVFVWVMMAALLSSALWINLATWVGAPVSTTHAVVGGVLGAGAAAAGVSAVNWPVMVSIAASWVISPVLGGVVAALLLAFIKAAIIYQDDKIAAARRWVPALLAVMASASLCYLIVKGLGNLWRPDYLTLVAIAFASLGLAYGALRPVIRRQSEGMENRNQSLRKLFHLPLIVSAAFLSFAHGANDVSNAVGPLAAILHAVEESAVDVRVVVPFWVMVIGAAGISLGLFLYGPRLIHMVGEQITRMNPMRAFCVALSAALTVIVASWFGLPVSSTHIAVGGVFGVGFYREYYTTHSKRRRRYVARRAAANAGAEAPADEPPEREEDQRWRKLVRRSHFMTIVAAWVITVPAAGVLAAVLFWLLDTLA